MVENVSTALEELPDHIAKHYASIGELLAKIYPKSVREEVRLQHGSHESTMAESLERVKESLDVLQDFLHSPATDFLDDQAANSKRGSGNPAADSSKLSALKDDATTGHVPLNGHVMDTKETEDKAKSGDGGDFSAEQNEETIIAKRDSTYSLEEAELLVQSFRQYKKANAGAQPHQYFELRRFPIAFETQAPQNDCHWHFLQRMTFAKLANTLDGEVTHYHALQSIFNHDTDPRFFDAQFRDNYNMWVCVLLFLSDNFANGFCFRQRAPSRRCSISMALAESLTGKVNVGGLLMNPSSTPNDVDLYGSDDSSSQNGLLIIDGADGTNLLSNDAFTPFTYHHRKFVSVTNALVILLAMYAERYTQVAGWLSQQTVSKASAAAFSEQCRHQVVDLTKTPHPTLQILRELCIAKFEQNPIARDFLMSTCPARLHYSSYDRFLGCGYAKGQESDLYSVGVQAGFGDAMGRLLTHIREQMKQSTMEALSKTTEQMQPPNPMGQMQPPNPYPAPFPPVLNACNPFHSLPAPPPPWFAPMPPMWSPQFWAGQPQLALHHGPSPLPTAAADTREIQSDTPTCNPVKRRQIVDPAPSVTEPTEPAVVETDRKSSTSTVSKSSTATVSKSSTATVSKSSTSTVSKSGTATVGKSGTATVGNLSVSDAPVARSAIIPATDASSDSTVVATATVTTCSGTDSSCKEDNTAPRGAKYRRVAGSHKQSAHVAQKGSRKWSSAKIKAVAVSPGTVQPPSSALYTESCAQALVRAFCEARRANPCAMVSQFLNVSCMPMLFSRQTPANSCHERFLKWMALLKMVIEEDRQFLEGGQDGTVAVDAQPDESQADTTSGLSAKGSGCPATLFDPDRVFSAYNHAMDERFCYCTYVCDRYRCACVLAFFDEDCLGCYYIRQRGLTERMACEFALMEAVGEPCPPVPEQSSWETRISKEWMKEEIRRNTVGVKILSITGSPFSMLRSAPFTYNTMRFWSVFQAYLFYMALYFEDYDSASRILLRLSEDHDVLRSINQSLLRILNKRSSEWFPEPAFNLVYALTRSKVEANPDVFEALLATGNTYIYASTGHWFFGCGYQAGEEETLRRKGMLGKYRNSLGVILTYIRQDMLKKYEEASTAAAAASSAMAEASCDNGLPRQHDDGTGNSCEVSTQQVPSTTTNRNTTDGTASSTSDSSVRCFENKSNHSKALAPESVPSSSDSSENPNSGTTTVDTGSSSDDVTTPTQQQDVKPSAALLALLADYKET